jgi:CHAD domain-containing protein
MIERRQELTEWAQQLIGKQVDAASAAIAAFCEKPGSRKRLHRTRKKLARLLAALDDLSLLAGVSTEFSERVRRVHRRAGKVRNTDVLLQRVDAYEQRAHGDEREQLRALRKQLRTLAKKRRRKLTAELQR